MPLSETSQKFILHWGEMGARWGVNRTVAQIHALLYLTGKPLPADEIADTLNVAVPTVNTYIRRIYEKLHVRSRSEAIARLGHMPIKGDLPNVLRRS